MRQWVSSLGQWNFDFDVGLREVSLLSVDLSLVPVLVHSLHQRDDVILLQAKVLNQNSRRNQRLHSP
jgi:hypothetical protein